MNHTNPADVELELLIGLFFSEPAELGQFEEVASADMPSCEQGLLAHDHHMTVTVEKHHGSPVDVRVLKTLVEGDSYSRKILLTRQSDGCVVQFGIVRLDLSLLEDEVRAAIESQKTPLGRVLIEHNVLREVKLLKLYRITADQALAQSFGIKPGETCYGRTALIYCNGLPAVELLEIVGNC